MAVYQPDQPEENLLIEYSRIELYYHRIEHDIYKRLIEQLHLVNIYDIHELISEVPEMKIPKKKTIFLRFHLHT
jgi:hypothetical protein